MRNLPSALRSKRWLRTLGLCVTVGLAGCAGQSPAFTTNADGTLGATAQIVSDLTFLFK